MPNWCEGKMKVRGSKENLVKFFKEGIYPVNYIGVNKEKSTVEVDECSILVKIPKGCWAFYVKGTRRNFIESHIEKWIDDTEAETQIAVLDWKAAWAINPDELLGVAKEFNLDFRIMAFERGMEFNQLIEIVNGEITEDQEITFDDYQWECVDPTIGG